MKKGKLSDRQKAVLGTLVDQEVGIKPSRIYAKLDHDRKLFGDSGRVSDTLRDLSYKDLVSRTLQGNVSLWEITHLGRNVYAASVDGDLSVLDVEADGVKDAVTDNFDIVIRQIEGLKFDYEAIQRRFKGTKLKFTKEEYEAVMLARSILELTNKGKSTVLAKMCERYYE